MSDISIKRTHHTTVAEAKKVADKVAAKLAKDYDLKSSWAGDVLNFTRSGVNGSLAVSAKDFKIDVKLGFLMAAFKGPIQGAIEQNLDKMLTPASTEKAAKPAAKAATKTKK
ncbi:MAG: polyhydroxyalkanoic acid system protein [Betaproteobacteria bacterium]|nr:MAG: polyhydroxyalkanoic acid system protein [Betaproteobacteria bacterium]